MVDRHELEEMYSKCMQGSENPEFIIWECSEGCGSYILPRDNGVICEHLKTMLRGGVPSRK